MSTADDAALCDALWLAVLTAQICERTGGTVGDLKAELEEIWLACTFAAESAERGNMKLLGRSPASGEVELVAGFESARGELLRVEADASAAVAAARGDLTLAQSRLDEFRRGLVEEYARAWRVLAEDLRRRAAESGDATEIVSVIVQGGLDGARMEPRLEFVRNVLSDEAAAADAKSDWLNGYLLRGDGLTSEALAGLVAELPELPVAAEDCPGVI